MRVLIQRVKEASVRINGKTVSAIGPGLLLFVGIENADHEDDIIWLSNKIIGLRIFDDVNGLMNLSLLETKGDILAVSQFTLLARVKKGFRPSYIDAAPPQISVPLYERLVSQLESDLGKRVYTGVFGAEMQIGLINDGPVTVFIDSKNKK